MPRYVNHLLRFVAIRSRNIFSFPVRANGWCVNTGTRERGRVAPVPRVQQHAFVRGPLKTRWFYLANPAGSWHSRGGLDREVCTAGVAILVTIPLRHRSHSNHLDSKSKTSPHEFSIRLSTRCIFFPSFFSLSLSERIRVVCLCGRFETIV